MRPDFKRGELKKDGFFGVMRAGKMIGQYCPHTNGLIGCGDWCPNFGEPILFEDESEDDGKYWELSTCRTVLTFTDFNDQRKEAK